MFDGEVGGRRVLVTLQLTLLVAFSFAQSDEGGDAILALRAYAYLHRLFLEFLQKNPSLITSAREIVQGFLDDPTKRTMEVSE